VQLSNGVPYARNIIATTQQGSWQYYYINVPSGATQLQVVLDGMSDDVDLYVNPGSKPTLSTWGCRPYDGGTAAETCTFASPTAGTWWIGVNNYATGTIAYRVRASFTTQVGGSFYTVSPCRILDTRTGSGLPAGYGPPSMAGNGAQRSFVLVGQCGIPAGAGAVLINAAVWLPTTQGDLRVFPAGVATPLVSTLNWGPNILALANLAIVQLGAGGAITVMVDGPGTVDIFFDVYGYFQ
jgi:hypothetical protein